MGVEEILIPMWPVDCIGILNVDAHHSRKKLGHEKNEKTTDEGCSRSGCRMRRSRHLALNAKVSSEL